MSGTMDVVLDTEISNVTVYPDRARLTLSGRLELSPGRQKAAFDELPLSLLPESVRVSGRGAAKVRLHGVEVRGAMRRIQLYCDDHPTDDFFNASMDFAPQERRMRCIIFKFRNNFRSSIK